MRRVDFEFYIKPRQTGKAELFDCLLTLCRMKNKQFVPFCLGIIVDSLYNNKNETGPASDSEERMKRFPRPIVPFPSKSRCHCVQDSEMVCFDQRQKPQIS